jgi:hypothetical protein
MHNLKLLWYLDIWIIKPKNSYVFFIGVIFGPLFFQIFFTCKIEFYFVNISLADFEILYDISNKQEKTNQNRSQYIKPCQHNLKGWNEKEINLNDRRAKQ